VRHAQPGWSKVQEAPHLGVHNILALKDVIDFQEHLKAAAVIC